MGILLSTLPLFLLPIHLTMSIIPEEFDLYYNKSKTLRRKALPFFGSTLHSPLLYSTVMAEHDTNGDEVLDINVGDS